MYPPSNFFYSVSTYSSLIYQSCLFFCFYKGWNHCETIDSLLRKGGYRGNISEAFRQSIRLTRYRSEKYSVHASEYLRARQNGYRV